MKILVARTDKLGDVVLALPVFAWLRARRPDWRLHAVVAPGCVPLVENDPAVARVWTWEGALGCHGAASVGAAAGGRGAAGGGAPGNGAAGPPEAGGGGLPAAAGAAPAAPLGTALATERFDAALLLYYDAALARGLRRHGVSPRVGPLSKWSSWLLLDRGVWQRRSRGGRHESEYNLRLARALAGVEPGSVSGEAAGGRPRAPAGGPDPVPRLALSPAQRERGRRFRAEEAGGADTVAFVHPGSGGSALNWPAERFGEVAARLAAAGWRVFLTGGPADGEAVRRAAAAAGPGVANVAGRWDLREFLGVLSGGDVLVGPSTGPLHMAAALGLAVAGVYPPLPVQSIGRWGPRGERVRAVAPALACPARLVCRGARCRHWNCLEKIGVPDVVALARAARAERQGESKA